MRLAHAALAAAVMVAPGFGSALVRTARADAPRPAATSGPSLFDPARHLRVSEVKVGMKGYGLSVFRGTKIERFDVEVVSILRNFNPKCDVVLISCKGANLEHTGAIAGMSGSPVFLKDESGRERMIGAFAYGWPLAKDPIAGVQPIEYMLNLPTTDPAHSLAGGATTRGSEGAGRTGANDTAGPDAGAGAGTANEAAGASAARWSLGDAAAQWEKLIRPPAPGVAAGLSAWRAGAGRLTGEDGVPELRPLSTPLMAGGLSAQALGRFGPALRAAGLVPLQAGGGSGGEPGDGAVAPAPLEPGSVLAVALLTGDMEMTALGTCTEVLGDRVFGFGHSFNNEGPVTLPMGGGRVNGIVATLSTSFKLGSMTGERGRLTADETVGVAGHLGGSAPMVPVELQVFDAEGVRRAYHFRAALHPKLTPLITGAAFASAVSGASELPEYNTVDYEVGLEFGNGRTVRVADRAVNTNAADLFQLIGLSIVSAGDNPYERVPLKKMTGTVRVAAQAREGQITDVNVPRLKYKPGETVKGFVTYRPFRAAEATMPVGLELPRDLPQGTYQLVVSDADRFMQDEQATKPFRFTAGRIGEIFEVIRDVTAVRHDALYLRLIRQPDGVAVGHTALPQLPGSRRQILLGSGRSDTTQFVSSTVKIIPTDRVMTGSAEFAITIETKGRTEAGGARPPTSRPAGPGKGEEAKPKGKTMEAPEGPAPKDAGGAGTRGPRARE